LLLLKSSLLSFLFLPLIVLQLFNTTTPFQHACQSTTLTLLCHLSTHADIKTSGCTEFTSREPVVTKCQPDIKFLSGLTSNLRQFLKQHPIWHPLPPTILCYIINLSIIFKRHVNELWQPQNYWFCNANHDHYACVMSRNQKKASEISAQNSRPNLHIQLLLSHNDDITSTAHCLLVQRFTRLYAKLPESWVCCIIVILPFPQTKNVCFYEVVSMQYNFLQNGDWVAAGRIVMQETELLHVACNS